jgi:hypothetical protein
MEGFVRDRGFSLEIGCCSFNMADVDRGPEFRLAMAASGFAGARANSSKDPWKNIGHPIDLVGTAVESFKSSPDVGRDIGKCRATTLARDIDVHVIEIFRLGGIDDLIRHSRLTT